MFNLCCPSCYKSTNYESTQPLFCSYCGKSFRNAFESTASQSKPVIAPPVQKPRPQIIIETDEDGPITVPNITKIEVVIDEELRPNRQKFESMSFVNEKPRPLVSSASKKSKNEKRPSKKDAERLWLESFPKGGKNSSNEIGGK